MFHLQIGTRNKTVLIYQFWNNVFHAQIGTQNKIVLIYQFENSMFHLWLGTFLFYTRANVLFLPCKTSGPLIVNGTQKRGTVDTRGTSFLEYRNSQRNLKSAKKKIVKDYRKTQKSVSQVLRRNENNL